VDFRAGDCLGGHRARAGDRKGEESIPMKPILMILLAGALLAQTPATVARLYDAPLSNIEREVVSLAEAMPADKFDFKPSGGAFGTVRTFGEQARHIATVAYLCAAATLKEKAPVDPGPKEEGPDSNRTKEQIVKYLKDSFAYAHKAARSVTAENQLEMVPSPFGPGQMPRGDAASIPTWHSFDHYGQMVVYARMNGVVPPASQPAPPPAAKKK
jgi:uncharacterized damage-inducible protein DinB